MKKIVPIGVVVLVLAALGCWYALAHYANMNNNTSTTNTMHMGTSGSNNGGSNVAQSTNKVTIANFAFSPASITVRAGTTVTWTNNDSTAHTVTENDGQSGPASGDINPGRSYSFTFTKSGTYHYHCAIHSSMTGTVLVTPAASE